MVEATADAAQSIVEECSRQALVDHAAEFSSCAHCFAFYSFYQRVLIELNCDSRNVCSQALHGPDWARREWLVNAESTSRLYSLEENMMTSNSRVSSRKQALPGRVSSEGASDLRQPVTKDYQRSYHHCQFHPWFVVLSAGFLPVYFFCDWSRVVL